MGTVMSYWSTLPVALVMLPAWSYSFTLTRPPAGIFDCNAAVVGVLRFRVTVSSEAPMDATVPIRVLPT